MKKIDVKSIAESDELFEKEIHKLKRFYKSNSSINYQILASRLIIVKDRNKDIKPTTDENYYCCTCGYKDGKEHPDTGYCFHCDTDNWEHHSNSNIYL